MFAVGDGPAFVDAFAGCGGLSLGLLRSGWRGMFAIEKDAFAFGTLKANLIDESARHRYEWPGWLAQKPWTIESLMDAHGPTLANLRGQVDLLAGGPPCQGFSSAGRRRKADPRNKLVKKYLAFVALVQPAMVLIENVRGITFDFVGKRIATGISLLTNLSSGLVKTTMSTPISSGAPTWASRRAGLASSLLEC